MAKKSNTVLLKLSLIYLDKIIDFSKGCDLNIFKDDFMIQDACLMNLINLGEKFKSLSQELRETHNHILFKEIIGLRNIASHTYEIIDPKELFEIVTHHVPKLRSNIQEPLEIIRND